MDVEEYFKKLSTLKQTSSLGEYIEEFEWIIFQVQNISPNRVVFLFINGLLDPLKFLVKNFEPTNLEDVINRTMNLNQSFH